MQAAGSLPVGEAAVGVAAGCDQAAGKGIVVEHSDLIRASDSDLEQASCQSLTRGDTLPPADLKVILLGDSAIGKSKLVERFLMDEYNPRQMSTFALTLFRHSFEHGGQKWSVDFWDTAGQEQFESLHPSYYFQANACILGFDVTRKPTYKNLET